VELDFPVLGTQVGLGRAALAAWGARAAACGAGTMACAVPLAARPAMSIADPMRYASRLRLARRALNVSGMIGIILSRNG
jgi:hypothetical protein